MHFSINSVARPTMVNREFLGIWFLHPRVLGSREGCSKTPTQAIKIANIKFRPWVRIMHMIQGDIPKAATDLRER